MLFHSFLLQAYQAYQANSYEYVGSHHLHKLLPKQILFIKNFVTFIKRSSSSSPLIANCKCLGLILFTLKSLDAFPASSSTSAVRYSSMAAPYTAAVALTRFFPVTRVFKNL